VAHTAVSNFTNRSAKLFDRLWGSIKGGTYVGLIRKIF
jgi:hypothetical protein